MKIKTLSRVGRLSTLTALTAVFAACGGGGGSGGVPNAPYKIELTADRYSIPLNLEHKIPGLGGYTGFGRESRYTIALEVKATIDGRPIPSSGEEEVFGCILDGAGIGRNTALYYLDGDDEHEVEIDVIGPTGETVTIDIPGAYRSIALPSNSGSATFHLHGDDTAGVAKITCSIQDPRDQQVRSASVEIQVGDSDGPETPTDLFIETSTTGRIGYTFTQGSGLNNQILLQAAINDIQNQPVPNPTANNLYARIVDGYSNATIGARLGSTSGGTAPSTTWAKAKTINGRATFNLRGGQHQGPILIEFLSDALDNNVDNGLTYPVSNLTVVYALDQEPVNVTSLDIQDQELPTGYFKQPYVALLQADGGYPPYTWSLTNGTALPEGLTLQSNGVITGTPERIVPARQFSVAVVDSTNTRLPWAANQRDEHIFTIAIEESQYDIHIAECGSWNAQTVCSLGSAVVGSPFVSMLTGAGGDGVYTWATVPESPIHGFLNFDSATATLTADSVSASLLTCTPGTPGTPGDATAVPPVIAVPAVPATYSDKTYEFNILVTSAGIERNQRVSVTVTADGLTTTSPNCP